MTESPGIVERQGVSNPLAARLRGRRGIPRENGGALEAAFERLQAGAQ